MYLTQLNILLEPVYSSKRDEPLIIGSVSANRTKVKDISEDKTANPNSKVL